MVLPFGPLLRTQRTAQREGGPMPLQTPLEPGSPQRPPPSALSAPLAAGLRSSSDRTAQPRAEEPLAVRHGCHSQCLCFLPRLRLVYSVVA